MSDSLAYQETINLSEELLESDVNKALEYSKSSLVRAKSTGNKFYISSSLRNVGRSYSIIGKNDSALSCFDEALKIDSLSGNNYGYVKTIYDLGMHYFYLEDYATSYNYYLRILRLCEKWEYSDILGLGYESLSVLNQSLNNYKESQKFSMMACDVWSEMKNENKDIVIHYRLGRLYLYQSNFEKAYNHYNIGLKASLKMNDSLYVMRYYSNLGRLYTDRRIKDSALIYLRKAEKYCKNMGNRHNLGIILTMISYNYRIHNDIDKAILYDKKALKTREKLGNKKYIASSYTNLSNVYLYAHELDSAEKYLLIGLDIARNVGSKLILRNAYEGMYHLRKAQGRHEEALEYYTKYEKTNLTIFNSETANKILNLKFSFEQEHIEKEKEIQKKSKQILILYFTIAFLLISSILIILLIRFISRKRLLESQAEVNKKIVMMNSELTQLNDKLRKSNQTKDKFFSIIAHELRNPLKWFKNLTELLSRNIHSLSEKDLQDTITQMNQSANNSYHLTENLLLWAKIQTQSIKIDQIDFDLNRLIGDLILQHKYIIERKNIVLTSKIKEKTMVYADYNIINTTLRNLLTNSIKNISSKGTIEISSLDQNEFIDIIVCDNGCGIDEDAVNAIFTSSINSKENISGFGLRLCSELLQMSGHKIIAHNNDNIGASIIVRIYK